MNVFCFDHASTDAGIPSDHTHATADLALYPTTHKNVKVRTVIVTTAVSDVVWIISLGPT